MIEIYLSKHSSLIKPLFMNTIFSPNNCYEMYIKKPMQSFRKRCPILSKMGDNVTLFWVLEEYAEAFWGTFISHVLPYRKIITTFLYFFKTHIFHIKNRK